MSETLNQKIDAAWLAYREAGKGLTGLARRQFQTRFVHLAADRFETDLERVWQRVRKIEKREER